MQEDKVSLINKLVELRSPVLLKFEGIDAWLDYSCDSEVRRCQDLRYSKEIVVIRLYLATDNKQVK